MKGPLLEVKEVCRSFGGLVAMDCVSFAVQPAEIRAIIGPNGAGKTTLFNVISRVLDPDRGTIAFQGSPIQHLQPHEAARLGITRTFQNLQLFHNMTVLENVMVGRHLRTRSNLQASALGLPWARRELAEAAAYAAGLLERVGLAEMLFQPAGELSLGQQRLLEMARALALEPTLLLLDEPMAGLNAGERQSLSHLIREVRTAGLTILFIEHDVEAVMGLADRILVLDYGRPIAEGTPREIQNHPAVIAAYLGEEVKDVC